MSQPHDNQDTHPTCCETAKGRREMLRTLGRSACLAGLAAVAAVLGVRRYGAGSGADTAAEECAPAWVCASCGRQSTCLLPRARSARKGQVS